MSESQRTMVVKTDDLDGLRTELTRGVSRILVKSVNSSIPREKLRAFIDRIGADEYEVSAPESTSGIDGGAGALLTIRPSASSDFARPGIPNDTVSDTNGPTTKFELRMVNLGLLDVRPGMTVWDVGAGTGSVSIESARLNPSARYWAIEANPNRYETLNDNIQRTRAYNVRAKQGEAPVVFSDCPDPDRVFIGGTSGHVESILDGIDQRLTDGGLILGNFLRMKHLETAEALLEQHGYDVELIQVAFHGGERDDNGSLTWQEGPALPVVRARKNVS